MQRKVLSRRTLLKTAALSATGVTLAACAPQTVTVVVTQQVEKEVTKEVQVTTVVETEKEIEKVVTATPLPEGPVEIVFYDRNVPQDIEFRKELAKRFTEQNPNITIKIEVSPDDYMTTLLARIASGTAGDMFRYGTHYGMANLALRGIFIELDDFVAKDSYDLGVYFPGSIEACKVEGKLYALPVNGHPGWSAIYYMPELFKEANVAEPTDTWTYDDMTQAAVKLTKGTDQYGLWVAPYYEASLTPISAFGGWPMSDDGTKAQYNDANTIAGVQWIHDVMQKDKVALPNPSFDSRTQLWSSGKVAMVLSGIWEGSYLGDATPNDKTMKVATGPIGPSGQRGGFVGVNVFPTLRSSKHPYEAWQWQKFLCSKEVGIENVKRIGEPGLRTDVWEDPALINDPLVKPHYELLRVVKPMPVPANGRLSEIADPVQQIYSGIWLGELSVEDGCAQIQEKLQQILDQPKPGL
ncbi:MAG: extracellular solute-binding protein [Chloroflexi bacterium]|nr:extracellular solute-binding protein [Chloroflexota bacterium]